MAKVFGIDLGTTYSAIATLNENGMPEVITNESEGESTLASAVYFQPGGNPVVGSVAKEQAIIEPDRVVQFIKREMGKSIEKRNFDGQEYDPIDISAIILKRMKEYAEESLGEEVKDVIITCPAYFGAEEKMATKQAGIAAGLNVLDIINEPTAAALNYCFKEHAENQKIMVYDLGGGTFDITLLDLSIDENDKKAIIDVVGSKGNDSLGGINWDARLFDLISSLYSDETGMELDEDAQLKVRGDIEAIKKRLSRKDSHSFNVMSNGDSTRIEVTESKFREVTEDLTEQTVSLVNGVLSEHSLTPDDINIVLLVGGSTRMTMIKDAVEGIFPGKVRVEEPDLAVAKGAALKAAYSLMEKAEELKDEFENAVNSGTELSEEQKQEAQEMIEKASEIQATLPSGFTVKKISDIIPRAFGPAVLVGSDLKINNLLFVGDKSPAEAIGVYGTHEDNQASVRIEIYENLCSDRENEKFIDPPHDLYGNEQSTIPGVKQIGELELPLEPGTPAGSAIEVMFRYSEVGLEATASDQRTGNVVDTVIVTENTKSAEELQNSSKFLSTVKTESDF